MPAKAPVWGSASSIDQIVGLLGAGLSALPHWDTLARARTDGECKAIRGLIRELDTTTDSEVCSMAMTAIGLRSSVAPDFVRAPWLVPLVTAVIKSAVRLQGDAEPSDCEVRLRRSLTLLSSCRTR